MAQTGLQRQPLQRGRAGPHAAVGPTGAVTLVAGELIRQSAPIIPNKPGEASLFGSAVRTPAEALVSDHLVHRDLFAATTRELRVYSELISSTTQHARDRLSVAEGIQELGRRLACVKTAEIANYGEILAVAFERAGWDAEEFNVYRVRMRHPPMPVSVMIRHHLPEAVAPDV